LPRRKFIKRDTWICTPHASSHPPSLWWYKKLAPEDSRFVLLTYLEWRVYQSHKVRAGSTSERWEAVCRALEVRAADGKVPHDFVRKLHLWISELLTNQGTKTKPVYWTLDGYAIAHKITKTKHPFLAWFRTLEKIAKELYPDRVPFGRRDKPLSEEETKAIRLEYGQTGDATEIAARHGIEDWRVGQICQVEKQIRKWDWDDSQARTESSDTPDSDTDPF
jgi:hypothetical protein